MCMSQPLSNMVSENDSAIVECQYKLSFRKDKHDSPNFYSTDTVIVHISKHSSHSFCVRENELSMNLHERFLKTGKRWTNLNNWYGYIGDVYNDYDRVTQHVRILMDAAGVYGYEEQIPTMSWKVASDRKKRILGYECINATCSFRGRKYDAWFCPSLPFKCGPWKFGGLPGLIMEILDASEDYIFTCVSINKKSRDSYNIDDSYIVKSSRKKMLQMQKMLCKKPGTFCEGYNVRINVEGMSGDVLGFDCNQIELK